jgi:hypothetical protein
MEENEVGLLRYRPCKNSFAGLYPLLSHQTNEEITHVAYLIEDFTLDRIELDIDPIPAEGHGPANLPHQRQDGSLFFT